MRCYLWRNNEYCSLYGGRFNNHGGVAGIEYIKVFFFTNQQPGGLVGLEYLEEESDLVYVRKDL